MKKFFATIAFAILVGAMSSNAQIAVSETIDMSDTTGNADVVKEYTAHFKEGAARGPLNKVITADIDTSYTEVLVVQLDNTHAIGPNVKGPDTQFVARVKFKGGKIGWVAAASSDKLLGTLNSAYDPDPNTTACGSCQKIAWVQADGEGEIPASALEK